MVVAFNILMSLPRMDTAFLAKPRWGATSFSAVGGVWSVTVALAAAIIALLLATGRRLPALRESIDAGANAAVLPAFRPELVWGFRCQGEFSRVSSMSLCLNRAHSRAEARLRQAHPSQDRQWPEEPRR